MASRPLTKLEARRGRGSSVARSEGLPVGEHVLVPVGRRVEKHQLLALLNLLSTGRGRVHSWIVSHHPTRPDDAPRIVALVQLEEGARLVTNLQDVEADQVVNDMTVRVDFREVDGVLLPQFVPDGAPQPAGDGPL